MQRLAPEVLKARRLRRLLLLFFFALLLPTGALLLFAFSQMKWEVYHQFRQQAETLTARVDNDLQAVINQENRRKFTDYRFLIVNNPLNPSSLIASPLAAMPTSNNPSGLIGHFQIGPDGQLTSPLVPDLGIDANAYGIGAKELAERQAITNKLREVLLSGSIVGVPAEDQQASLQSPLRDGELDSSIAPYPPSAAPTPKLEKSTAAAPSFSSIRDMRETTDDKARSRKNADKKDALKRFNGEPKSVYRQNKQRLGSVAELQLDERLDNKASERAIDDDDTQLNAALSAASGNRSPAPQPRRIEQVTAYEFAKKPQQQVPSALASTDNATKSETYSVSPESEVPESELIEAREEVDRIAFDSIPEEHPTQGTVTDGKRAFEEQLQKALEPTELSPTSSFITSFESEVEPFNLTVFDDEHIVLYRNVWRNNERLVQGAVLHRETFIGRYVKQAFLATPLASMSQLLVAFNDDVLNIFGATKTSRYLSNTDSLTGSVLYRSKLAEPFGHFSLLFNIAELPLGASIKYLLWVTLVLLCVLLGGCYFMYRFGKGQIALFKQQQDFVSAVSHELKTPLTSIRMYSEMLENGWASEEKKPTYYAYIHSESERLSRLIENVLQLARINRNQADLKLESTDMREMLANAMSKVSSIVETTDFNIVQRFDEAALCVQIKCSQDATLQIMINIVDNAIKFSRTADKKQIDIRVDKLSGGAIEIGIRDYGPGVEQTQMKKIFELFYRTENELTRETVGTGIGLALVHQMAAAMGARVDARNCNPGVEFTVTWPNSLVSYGQSSQ